MNYKLVSFPEIQAYMDHERWDECMLCISTDAESASSNDYAVPEDLYYEINRTNKYELKDLPDEIHEANKAELKDLLEEAANLINIASSVIVSEAYNKDMIENKLLYYAKLL